jgi:GGDEF domain-containing protein
VHDAEGAGAGWSEGPRELDLITRDLATKPAVASVLIAAANARGAATVLSSSGAVGRAVPRRSDFASRAVRAQRAMIETLDPARDWSFGGPLSAGGTTYAVGSPVRVSGGRAVALCAAMTGPWPGSDPEVLWLVDAYARLASLWLGDLGGGLFATASSDAATGCLSYIGLVQELERQVTRCRRTETALTCCFVNVRGGAAGTDERALATIGHALRAVMEERGSIGRYGEERFVLIIPGADAEAGAALAGEVCVAITSIAGHEDCSMWTGVAEWIPGTGAERLLGDADAALTVSMRLRPERVAP